MSPSSPIEFWVQGKPKGQPRPRAFARGGHAAVYDPGTAEGWKSCVAVAAAPHVPREPLACPLVLVLTFHMPRPKSHYSTSKFRPGLKSDAPTWFTGKPDADNLAKAVMDALTTLRMWRDDAPVVRLIVEKWYENGQGPGMMVRITPASAKEVG